MPNEEIISLEKEVERLRSEPDSSELVDVLNRIAYACLHSDPHKSKAYALESYDLAENLGLTGKQAKSNIVLGIFYLEAGDFDEAMSRCRCAMEIYESLEDRHGIASVHSSLANIFLVQGLIDKALADVKRLQGLLPICANCRQVRNDDGYWQQIECYISDHSKRGSLTGSTLSVQSNFTVRISREISSISSPGDEYKHFILTGSKQ